MPLYTTKAAFFAEGINSCSIPHEQPNCPICIEELVSNEVHPAPTQPTNGNTPHSHASVTSIPCGQNNVIVVNTITTLRATGT
jgi:hypothetical protein